MSNTYQAVVDRISEDIAVILVDSLKKEYHYDLSETSHSLREGLWLDITINAEDQIETLTPNQALTKLQEEKINNVMSRVRKRKGSKFKK